MSKGCPVDKILEDCLEIHKHRDEAYGAGVFERTAEITSILTKKHFDAFDVAACFAAMKLARYAYQANRTLDHRAYNPTVIEDSLKDAIVYLALTERVRMGYDDKERTTPTAQKPSEPGNRSAEHTDLSGIKPFVPPSSTKEDTRPEDSGMSPVYGP